MDNRLSKHFTLKELTRSANAIRRGISNIPNEMETANLQQLCIHILEPVRIHFNIPFSPSSGFRNSEVNRLAGSKNTSQHRTGHAADFEIPTIANADLANWIKANLIFDQLILEFYHKDDPSSGWIHCSYVQENNRQQSLVFNGKHYEEF